MLPTVVTGLAPDSALATEEQFGPVLPIFGYDEHRRCGNRSERHRIRPYRIGLDR